MMRLISALVIALFVLGYGACALAAPPCTSHAAMAEALARQFGETVQAQALTQDGRLVAIWANLKTGTWTATISSQGRTCMVAAGDHFQATKPGEPA